MTDEELDWFNPDLMTRTRHQVRVWNILTMPIDRLLEHAVQLAAALAGERLARQMLTGEP